MDHQWSFPTQLKSYPIRWVHVLVVAVLQMLWTYGVVNMHQSNETVKILFKAGGSDFWQIESAGIAFTAALLFLAWPAKANKMKLRLTAVLAGCFETCGFFMLALPMLNIKLYPLSYVGQVMLGFAGAMLYLAQTMVTYTWFNENQIGASFGFLMVGLWSGVLLGDVLPKYLYQFTNKTLCNNCNVTAAVEHNRYIIMDSSIASLALACLCLVWILFATQDQPDSPPTRVQARRRIENEDSGENWVTRHTCSDYMASFFGLCKESNFFLWVVFTAMHVNTAVIAVVFMKDIFRADKDKFGTEMDPEQTSGLILLMYGLGALLGSVLSGLCINLIRRYLLIVRVAGVLSFVAAVFVFVAFYYVNVPGLCAANFLLAMFVSSVVVTGFDAMTQHTYPEDETFAICAFGAQQGLAVLVTSLLDKQALFSYGSNGLFGVMQCGGLLVALICSVFMKTSYKRLEMEEILRTGRVQGLNGETVSLLQRYR